MIDLHEGILEIFGEAGLGFNYGELTFHGSGRSWAWQPPRRKKAIVILDGTSWFVRKRLRERKNDYRRRVDAALRAARPSFVIEPLPPLPRLPRQLAEPLPFVDWAFIEQQSNRVCSPWKNRSDSSR